MDNAAILPLTEMPRRAYISMLISELIKRANWCISPGNDRAADTANRLRHAWKGFHVELEKLAEVAGHA